MKCPNCRSFVDMEREDCFEFDGLHWKLTPAATYYCTECGSVFYWRLHRPLIHDIDNVKPEYGEQR